MRHYTPKHFRPPELLPPSLYEASGASALIVMDARILFDLDRIREYYGRPLTVNNWHLGGPFSQRGFRNANNTGAKLSQHRFGRAIDFDINGIPAEQFRTDVKAGKLASVLTYVTRIEIDTSWVHIDCASVPGTEIVFFKP